jgi:predicted transcriptional regulator
MAKRFTPNTIKCKLIERGISQRSIAHKLSVTPVAVCRVIHLHDQSKRIQDAVAKAIGYSARDVFPQDDRGKRAA